jgi:hypothetical protein
MKDLMNSTDNRTPVLFPYEPEEYWKKMRQIIQEEIRELGNKQKQVPVNTFQTPGLDYKPLYKIAEVCLLFHVTKPTIYDWIKHGKLKPFKIRSRVYFLWDDIRQLIQP